MFLGPTLGETQLSLISNQNCFCYMRLMEALDHFFSTIIKALTELICTPLLLRQTCTEIPCEQTEMYSRSYILLQMARMFYSFHAQKPVSRGTVPINDNRKKKMHLFIALLSTKRKRCSLSLPLNERLGKEEPGLFTAREGSC